jgi:hypothetical protein
MSARNLTSRRRTLRLTAATVTVAAAIATGGFAASTASASPVDAAGHGGEYVDPSPQVMREMVAVIQALYGPQRHAHRAHSRNR